MKLSLFTTLFAGIFLVACQKETISNTSSNYNYINFSINNQNIAFNDSSKITPDSIKALYFNGVSDSSLGGVKLYALSMVGAKQKDSSSISLIIIGLSGINAGSYTLIDSVTLANPLGLVQPKFFGANYSTGTTVYAPRDDMKSSGSIQLTKMDVGLNVVEGNFLQNNITLYDLYHQPISGGINMSGGVFRARLLIINQADFNKYRSGLPI